MQGRHTVELLVTPQELHADLAQLQVEALGWLPLATEEGEWAYLHLGDPLVLCESLNNTDEEIVIEVVGVADAGMVGMNVLWVV
jgi:hypothetical protein